MTPPLNRRDLDAGTCAVPGCDHTAHGGLFLHGVCHPGKPVYVQYRATGAMGILTITCAMCGRPVVDIEVADANRSLT